MDNSCHKKDMVVKSVSCDVGQKPFKTKSYLKIYKKIHTGKIPYKCDTCDKRLYINNYINIKVFFFYLQ